MIFQTTYLSPVGALTLTSDGVCLTGLYTGDRHAGVTGASLPVFAAVQDWLDRYFSGGKPDLTELALNPEGTEYQRAVWALLCGIPYGTVTTYGDLAKKVAARMGKSSMSAQAVGGAVGRNPIWIIIPCHRVVGADGSLTGYAGGIEMKAALLALEMVRR